ncbi:ectoine/hydroxyectoine ABC transporter substrate-binding protein EhuB [Ensifer adhaerens]|uniref:ectoine/hydroxyectoine ABC transporter substrate-binding protein EhuB n=1 Tax=Ensifer adhaerens TaxID=106592 RepID=UPI000CF13D79|nr:ectoine/hydroxyectoine ABC transporter substrate-binding protein EhuB [Ensifer adhaerens]
MNRTRRALTVTAFALALSFGPGAANIASAESLDAKGHNEGLTIAFYSYRPNAYLNEAGDLVGTDPETVRAVLEDMGLKIADMVDTDWGNLVPGLNAGRFDIVAAGMYVTPDRCKQVAFSEPYLGFSQAMAIPKGNSNGLQSIEDLAAKGLKVAVIAGSAQVGYAADAGVLEANVMQVPDTATGAAALRAGRVDALYVDAPGIRALVDSVPERDLEMTKPFDTVKGRVVMPHGAFAFRQTDAEFVKAFNVSLKKRLASSEQVEMLKRNGLSADEMPRFSTENLCAGK